MRDETEDEKPSLLLTRLLSKYPTMGDALRSSLGDSVDSSSYQKVTAKLSAQHHEAINAYVRASEGLQSFLELEASQQDLYFSNKPPHFQYTLLSLCIDSAFGQRFSAPFRALDLVNRCAALTPKFSSQLSTGLRSNALARIYIHRGNVYRILGRHRDSEQEFDSAHAHLRDAIDPDLKAEYSFLRASLELELGNLRSALLRSNHAVKIYSRYRHRDLSLALVQRALVQMELENHAEAAADALRASELAPDDRTVLLALHAYGRSLWAAGRPRDALRHLVSMEPLYAEDPQPAFLHGRDWLYGLVYNDLGWFDDALARLRPTREAFVAGEQTADATQIGLDIVIALVGNNEVEAAIQLAAELHAVAVAHGFRQDAIASYLALKGAVASAATRVALAAAAKAIRSLPDTAFA